MALHHGSSARPAAGRSSNPLLTEANPARGGAAVASDAQAGPGSGATGGRLVYVPCAVVLTAPGSVAATIAAEGSITVAASTVSVRPTGLDAPALVSGQNVVLSGAGASVGGMLLAPAGAVTVSGSGAVVRCGIVARTVAVVGAKSQITVDDRRVTG